MCNYLSFCGDLNGEQFWFEPMLSSHSATAELHKLNPDTYREYEWVTDDDSGLSVRVHQDDPHDASWLRACVLAKWPTRKALEEWLIVNVPQSRIYRRIAQGGHRSTLTGGDDSVLAIWEIDSAYKRIRHVAIVGKDNIKPNVPYRIVSGKFTEVPQATENQS